MYTVAIGLAFAGMCVVSLADSGWVDSHKKVDRTLAEFPNLPEGDVTCFASALADLGDLDGVGPATSAVAIGSHRDWDGVAGQETGSVFIAFLDAAGDTLPGQTVRIASPTAPANGVRFGHSVAAIEDLDGDGITEIVVGGTADDDGVADLGSVWIFFLNDNGTIKPASTQKISAAPGGPMDGLLNSGDQFGIGIAGLGQLSGPCGMHTAIAVGSRNDDDGGHDRGAVYILWLDTDGIVLCQQKISDTQGGFTGAFVDDDEFGFSITAVQDLDGDGVIELAVAAQDDLLRVSRNTTPRAASTRIHAAAPTEQPTRYSAQLARLIRNPRSRRCKYRTGPVRNLTSEWSPYNPAMGEMSSERAQLSSSVMAAVQRHVNEHIAGPISVRELAAVAGLSESCFARRFKDVTGTTPHCFVAQARVAKAKAILENSPGSSIASVAAQTGFSDQAHMTRLFKRVLGQTPGEILSADQSTQRRSL